MTEKEYDEIVEKHGKIINLAYIRDDSGTYWSFMFSDGYEVKDYEEVKTDG